MKDYYVNFPAPQPLKTNALFLDFLDEHYDYQEEQFSDAFKNSPRLKTEISQLRQLLTLEILHRFNYTDYRMLSDFLKVSYDSGLRMFKKMAQKGYIGVYETGMIVPHSIIYLTDFGFETLKIYTDIDDERQKYEPWKGNIFKTINHDLAVQQVLLMLIDEDPETQFLSESELLKAVRQQEEALRVAVEKYIKEELIHDDYEMRSPSEYKREKYLDKKLPKIPDALYRSSQYPGTHFIEVELTQKEVSRLLKMHENLSEVMQSYGIASVNFYSHKEGILNALLKVFKEEQEDDDNDKFHCEANMYHYTDILVLSRYKSTAKL